MIWARSYFVSKTRRFLKKVITMFSLFSFFLRLFKMIDMHKIIIKNEASFCGKSFVERNRDWWLEVVLPLFVQSVWEDFQMIIWYIVFLLISQRMLPFKIPFSSYFNGFLCTPKRLNGILKIRVIFAETI